MISNTWNTCLWGWGKFGHMFLEFLLQIEFLEVVLNTGQIGAVNMQIRCF